MKLLFSYLFLFLNLSISPIASADNGVERGSIEFPAENKLPPVVRNFLEKLMFAHCDLRDAALIRPSFLETAPVDNELGSVSKRYKIEFEVSYKSSSERNTIFADIELFQPGMGESRISLRELRSPICRKLP